MPLRSLFLLLLLLVATGAAAQEPAVRFDGDFATPLSVDRAALAKLPRTTVSASDHGKPGTWEGVAFDELLKQAGAPLGDALRGGKLASFVVVGATDGYRVVFSLAEFDAAFGATRAILADTRDGKPLDAHEGPFRLIVPDEKRPGRWVRQVDRVELHSALPQK
ncbi:MAG TPA: molybdopterin-dependent oxidoreductase [Tahibacter sp.]|nr:molybdopterin-dependent oxidoreductase [Tahibacter sp.]